MISLTKAAEIYLQKLKSKPENQHKELRLEAIDPDTAYAEAGLSFVAIGPEHADDVMIGFDGFQLYIDGKNKEYLYDATIDIVMKNLQTDIIIETPHLQPISLFEETSPLADKVYFLLETEINPALAAHGGRVHLVNITDDNIVLLQFSGGCQGCSQIDVTMKQGIKTALLEKIPDITDVQDVTDHTHGDNPYY